MWYILYVVRTPPSTCYILFSEYNISLYSTSNGYKKCLKRRQFHSAFSEHSIYCSWQRLSPNFVTINHCGRQSQSLKIRFEWHLNCKIGCSVQKYYAKQVLGDFSKGQFNFVCQFVSLSQYVTLESWKLWTMLNCSILEKLVLPLLEKLSSLARIQL